MLPLLTACLRCCFSKPLRFFDVTGGAILLDGQDLRSITQSSLRAIIGMVPQDCVLFNDSIRYNIRWAEAYCVG
jgi:ABC-type transport system involved in Fe-S cluster assembly fused permease/ATPase subunit